MAAPALLSFDFEDWHQLVRRRLGLRDWDVRGDALERQTAFVLDLLDELHATATFCLLGITVRRYPDLAREIVARGHEPAAHGFAHVPVHAQTRLEFRRDLEASVAEIERATGRRPVAYRAPLFSINRATPWAYEELAAAGFRYDSSQYDSPRVPDRIRSIPSRPYRLYLPSGATIWELPIAVARIAGRAVPVGGGSAWRLLPAWLLVRCLRGADEGLPVLYLHPYECNQEPLRLLLPPSASTPQRLRAFERAVWRNAGRSRVPDRLRAIAREFTLRSYEHAYPHLEANHGSCTRALSREGVLV